MHIDVTTTLPFIYTISQERCSKVNSADNIIYLLSRYYILFTHYHDNQCYNVQFSLDNVRGSVMLHKMSDTT